MLIHYLLFLVRLWQLRNRAYFLHDCKRGDYMFLCNALVLCQVLSSACALLFRCISVLLNPMYHNIVSIPLLRIPMSRKADKVEKGRERGVNLCQRIPCSLKNLVCEMLRPIFIDSFPLPSCCIPMYIIWFQNHNYEFKMRTFCRKTRVNALLLDEMFWLQSISFNLICSQDIQ